MERRKADLSGRSRLDRGAVHGGNDVSRVQRARVPADHVPGTFRGADLNNGMCLKEDLKSWQEKAKQAQ